MITLPIYQPPATVPKEMQAAILDKEYKFLVCFSGGKDSVAMVLYLLDMGVSKDRITLHHHEVDGGSWNLFDWATTTQYCQAFADAFELDLLFSYRAGGILGEMLKDQSVSGDYVFQTTPGGAYQRKASTGKKTTRLKFPAISASLMTRWCSGTVKIDVLRRALANSAIYKTGKFIVCTGERREESAARAKYSELEKHPNNTKKRTVWAWRPVLDFTEQKVWDLYKKYKVQPHPCYELGWSRCSCQLCIFGSNNTWATLYEIQPAKIGSISQLENFLNFTMHNTMGIMERVEKGTSWMTTELKEKWLDQAIKNFTAPIFVKEWKAPSGAFGQEKSGAL